MEGARQAPQSNIRFPAELKAHLKEQAKRNRRSLNDEIVWRLEQSKKEDEKNAAAA